MEESHLLLQKKMKERKEKKETEHRQKWVATPYVANDINSAFLLFVFLP